MGRCAKDSADATWSTTRRRPRDRAGPGRARPRGFPRASIASPGRPRSRPANSHRAARHVGARAGRSSAPPARSDERSPGRRKLGWICFTATSRPSSGSSARHTTPKAPSPTCSRSRYPRSGRPVSCNEGSCWRKRRWSSWSSEKDRCPVPREELLGRPIRLERLRLPPDRYRASMRCAQSRSRSRMLDGQSLEVGQRLRVLPDGETGAQQVLQAARCSSPSGRSPGERRASARSLSGDPRHSSSPSANVAAASRGSGESCGVPGEGSARTGARRALRAPREGRSRESAARSGRHRSRCGGARRSSGSCSEPPAADRCPRRGPRAPPWGGRDSQTGEGGPAPAAAAGRPTAPGALPRSPRAGGEAEGEPAGDGVRLAGGDASADAETPRIGHQVGIQDPLRRTAPRSSNRMPSTFPDRWASSGVTRISPAVLERRAGLPCSAHVRGSHHRGASPPRRRSRCRRREAAQPSARLASAAADRRPREPPPGGSRTRPGSRLPGPPRSSRVRFDFFPGDRTNRSASPPRPRPHARR